MMHSTVSSLAMTMAISAIMAGGFVADNLGSEDLPCVFVEDDLCKAIGLKGCLRFA